MPLTPSKERLGIQSIEVGARLLRALTSHGKPMMLRDLALAANMPAAKAHRYLVSFLRTGLVEQDHVSGRYGLGAFALDLGLASLARLDSVRLAGPILEDLCETIGETVGLAVWGTHGATIVRLVEPSGPITVTLRAGTVLPLANSATGRAFAAFLNSAHIRQLIEQSLKETAESTGTSVASQRREYEKTLEEIRYHGIARASGSITPGINGFSVPVFDHGGRMIAAITALGSVGMFDNDWNSSIAQSIKEAAASLSHQLGFHSDAANKEQGSDKQHT
jgi:DNA-binding IclR family transcriptional regulator